MRGFKISDEGMSRIARTVKGQSDMPTWVIQDTSGDFWTTQESFGPRQAAEVYTSLGDLPAWLETNDGLELSISIFSDDPENVDIRYYEDDSTEMDAVAIVVEA